MRIISARWIANLTFALLSILAISSEFSRIAPNDALWDFGSFIASARAAREGMNPYGVYPLTLHVQMPGFEAWNPNLNPPISVLLFQVLDTSSPHEVFRIWRWISVAFYSAAIILLLRRFGGVQAPVMALWAFALAGFWDTLLLGQIYSPLVFASVAAWLFLEREEPIWAGILIGLVIAMKPNFLVWPALLFLSGYRRPAMVATLVAAVVSAIPLAVYGVEIYQRWFELIASDRARAFFLTNASISGLAIRAGMPSLGLILSVALLIGLALWAFRKKPNAVSASRMALCAAVLASPLGWIHYTLFLLPVFFERWEKFAMRIVALLLIIPVPYVIAQFGRPAWIQLSIGSVYGWALVFCFLSLCADEWDQKNVITRRLAEHDPRARRGANRVSG